MGRVNVLKKFRAVLGYLVLTLGVTLAISLAFVAISEIKARDNSTRCAVVGLVVKLTANSQRAAQATIASPTATQAQKDAARTNVATIMESLRVTREVLGNPHGPHCLETP